MEGVVDYDGICVVLRRIVNGVELFLIEVVVLVGRVVCM